MSKVKATYFKKIILTVFVLSVSTLAMAQPDPGGDPDVPIDGGIGLLLAAGIGYGAKKIHNQSKIS